MNSRLSPLARVMLAMPTMRGAVVFAIAGCAYQPGSFDTWGHDFAGRHSTVDCVDLSIARRADHATGPVLVYDFGNRCDRPVTIDLKAATVVAKTAHGDALLVPYDPKAEIRALPLDGRSAGSEAIEYRIAADADPMLSICVDAASVVDTATSNWECFDEPSRRVR